MMLSYLLLCLVLLASLVQSQNMKYISTRAQPLKLSEVVKSGQIIQLGKIIDQLTAQPFNLRTFQKNAGNMQKALPTSIVELTSLLPAGRDIDKDKAYTKYIQKFQKIFFPLILYYQGNFNQIRNNAPAIFNSAPSLAKLQLSNTQIVKIFDDIVKLTRRIAIPQYILYQ